jgi:hypothetical protein
VGKVEVARQGRRRQGIAALVWSDVYFLGDMRMPAAVSKALGNVRIMPEDVFSYSALPSLAWAHVPPTAMEQDRGPEVLPVPVSPRAVLDQLDL